MALALVKQAGINSIDDKNERARVCRIFYDTCRLNILSRHRWHFALSRIKLAKLKIDDSEKMEGYDYYYQYPPEALQLVSLHNAGDYETKLSIKETYLPKEGQRSILGTEDGLEGMFVINITDTSKFTPQFTRALSYDIAANIAPILTGNDALAKDLMQRAEFYLQNAENNNSAEYYGAAERESDTFSSRSS